MTDPLPRRWLVALATILGIAGLGVSIACLVIWAGLGFARLPTRIEQIPLITATLYVGVGWLLASRVPGNPVGWGFMVGGLALTLVLPLELAVAQSHQALRPAPAQTVLFAWFVSSFATPVFMASLIVGGLLFPDGHFLSVRWRNIAVIAALAATVLGMSVAADPEGLLWYPTLPNPFRAPATLAPLLTAMRAVSLGVLILSIAGVLVGQILRYRLGDAVTRVQLRWVLAAVVVQVAIVIPFFLTNYVVDAGERVRQASLVLAQAALWLLPLASALAIMRYRLFGIDALIGRSQVYVPLMGVLGGLYALAVLVFQRIFLALTGGTSDLALLLAVFLIAGAFTPMRKGLESALERWARPSARALVGTSGAPRRAVRHDDDPGRDESPSQFGRDIQETAARLVALGRLEARLASPSALAGPRSGAASEETTRQLPIDPEGRVACPLGPTPYMTCLGCPHLSAIRTQPPAIDCVWP
jgi:hypothetical protein